MIMRVVVDGDIRLTIKIDNIPRVGDFIVLDTEGKEPNVYVTGVYWFYTAIASEHSVTVVATIKNPVYVDMN